MIRISISFRSNFLPRWLWDGASSIFPRCAGWIRIVINRDMAIVSPVFYPQLGTKYIRTFVGSRKMRLDKVNSFECVSDSNNNNSATNEFGNFQNTSDWIECESESSPDRPYFFNLRTNCTTWARPVSRNVTLPRYRKHPRIYDKNFTCDIDNQPTIVSSESEDSCQSSNLKNDHKFHRSSNEIFAWLYHGTPYVLRDEQDPCSPYKKSTFHEVFDKIQTFNGVMQNVAPTADYLEMKLPTSNDAIKIAERNVPPTSEDDDSLIVEKCIAFSSSSSENNHSAQLVPNHYAPRLPRIKSKYLLKEKIRRVKRKWGRVPEKKSVQKIPRKIVCELYGTKTINYDHVEPDLPPGVKRTNLSDSSATSSLWREEHAVLPVNPANFQLIDFCSHTNLSSDSTSSCSCTSCSCSSTSSDASHSSVSNTSKREQK
ncbi:uncharacterized protein LOC143207986 isoform X2 [Lasioglossum baleicum]|uniref:uncharacterized protein LOC143207986 isoform X2 n=1 Tax=Lasioglossum baleicum TaxID=434251 RepID=UPI003FCDF6F5